MRSYTAYLPTKARNYQSVGELANVTEVVCGKIKSYIGTSDFLSILLFVLGGTPNKHTCPITGSICLGVQGCSPPGQMEHGGRIPVLGTEPTSIDAILSEGGQRSQ